MACNVLEGLFDRHFKRTERKMLEHLYNNLHLKRDTVGSIMYIISNGYDFLLDDLQANIDLLSEDYNNEIKPLIIQNNSLHK